MKPLILGDGLFGSELVRQTSWDYISRKKDNIDFNNEETYIDKLSDYDAIINCIGYTKTTDNTKENHWNVNYLGVIKLVDICNNLNKKLVHISSDYIYGNSKSFASETDVPVHLGTWYTYTKLLSDGHVQAVSNNYLMIRSSFKERPFPWDSAWIDLITNGDYVDTIVDLTVKLIKTDSSGVYNVGTETKTMYELANKTKKCAPTMDEYKFIRPHDITMNLSKMNKKI